ncbi:hypothetical protein [Dyadobacter luticola]|uniref:Uncharacterized protein n=1 Tax=Dyadobacter luticola TaxID=1979387 RepID=A0A5R9KYD2_9BACT|nr:hypothetical protein [Dyadobacter luticola]TLV01322.1 hypothetical protein FEN17_17965 [Dyadobacter luticola]
MKKAKGIQANSFFKLGKAAPRRDTRNLRLRTLLRAPFDLPIPNEYDFDAEHLGIPTPMFANDTFGDCVIAGRAHQTLRFELIEQSRLLLITDQDVLDQYFLETGGEDNGLVVLDSLNAWRRNGWKIAGKTFRIRAYAEVDPTSSEEMRRAIFMDLGVGLGLSLPTSAETQINVGKPWDVVSDASGEPNSWGGHYVYVSGYTVYGPVCITWGRRQQMTWAFVDAYCDEAYAIFDALNTAKLKQGLDIVALNSFIDQL